MSPSNRPGEARASLAGIDDKALSLTAEVLLLAIDPGGGGLLAKSRRLRRALVATHQSEHEGPGVSGAQRSALAELERAGLISPPRPLKRPRLADRAGSTQRFRRVCRCLEKDGDAADSRDWELLVLLAWSGVLARRLSKDERRVAGRRLRDLFRTSGRDDLWTPPGCDPQAMPAWVPLLGGIAALASETDPFEGPGVTEFGSDHSGFKAPFG